jgi:hypothetical protein
MRAWFGFPWTQGMLLLRKQDRLLVVSVTVMHVRRDRMRMALDWTGLKIGN